MRRLVGLLLWVMLSYRAWGQAADTERTRALADFDVRDWAAAQQPAAVEKVRAEGLRAFLATTDGARPGTRLVANRHGLPKLLRRDGGALSAPSADQPEAIAKRFLRDYAAILPLTSAEIDGLRLAVKDVTAEATYLVFNQTLDGIDVFNGQIKFTISRRGEVIQAGAADIVPELSMSTVPRLTAAQAIRLATGSVGAEGTALLSPATAELSIFPMTAGSARLAYRVFLDVDPEGWYEILIDAQDGSLLFRHNLYLSAGSATVWTQSPMQSARQEVIFPDGWIPADGKVTTGNNVDAFVDASSPYDSADPINNEQMQNGRAHSLSQTFSFEFGDGLTGLNPRNYKPSSVTNLFYFINRAHDYFYDLGFTESAGNFQSDNFERGGKGNDAVLASAQFGGFTNNAAFAPTIEGTAPRLRMGLFTRSTSTLTDDLDSAYSGQVVVHEYAHGVSTRLVGGGTSTSCLSGIQSGALGEGWSDYFGVSFFNDPVMGAYETQNPVSGVRRQSYEGYTFTYEDIGGGTRGYEVHADGEIWAAALWDLRKSLGQEATDRLVVNGLKSTPCRPAMTDARDAILSADQVHNGGANRSVIWQVFARHGLGYSAAATEGSAMTGTRYDAAYDLPPDLGPAAAPSVSSDPLQNRPGMGGLYAYQMAARSPSGGALSFALAAGPEGMAVDAANGLVTWTAGFTGQRVKIVVTDRSGGKVVHGYLLPVLTQLAPGVPLAIAGPQSSIGYAYFDVPSDVSVPVLQVTTRGGKGDADLAAVTDPDGRAWISARTGNSETLSFIGPKPGRWQITVGGYRAYSECSLAVSFVTPTLIEANTTRTGLSGDVSSETLYRVSVPAGTAAFSVWTRGGGGDVDLYLRRAQPALCQATGVTTPCYYDKRSINGGSEEAIGVASPAAGDWYLDLSAFSNYGGVTLTTSTHPVSVVTPPALPAATVGVPYCLTLAASGGTTSYQWAVVSGTLPEGLALSRTGGITGTPAAAGSRIFTVRATDSTLALSSTAELSLTVSEAGAPARLATVSAASYAPGAALAPESIAAIFGAGRCLAPTVAVAPAAGPLPTELGNISVKVQDSAGAERRAPLWFVAPEQINYLVPRDTATGLATVTVMNQDQVVIAGTVQVEAVAPGLFTMNADGQGVPAALAIRTTAGASESWRYVFTEGCYPGSCLPSPIDLGPETDQVFLQLYGTGIRGRGALSAVSATIGGQAAAVEFAGPVEGYSGLDQVNLRVPRSLAGRGEVEVALQVEGKRANAVRLSFK